MSDLSGKIVTGRRPQKVEETSVFNERVNQLSQASTVPVEINVSAEQIDQYQIVTFQAISSSVLTSWSWSFGDGLSSKESQPSHVYAGGAGSFYTVSLVVTDNNGRVGFVTANNIVEVVSSKYINEQLNGTQAIISLQNKVDPAQNKWADIRDSANNNIHTIGFSGNKVDHTKISNKVSGDPFIESFYDPNDNIFATEPTASVQWKIVNNLYAAFVNFGNQNIGFYQLSNVINFDRASYYLAVLEKDITSTPHNPFDTDPNATAAGVSIGSGVVQTRGFDGLGNGNGYQRVSNEFTLIELIGDSQKMQVIVDGYRGNAIENSPSSNTIHALHSKAQPNVDFYEMFFSTDPIDRGKYKSYINNAYGLNIP